MNKKEFIEFLDEQCKLNEWDWHWERTYSNSDDDWSLRKAGVDCYEDYLTLREDELVKLTRNGTGNYLESKSYIITYDQFVENYDKTLR